MEKIPESGFIRILRIIGCKKSDIAPLIPVSKSTWWEGVKSGRFPKPVKLGKRITVWKVQDIRNLLEKGVDNISSSKKFPKEKIGKQKKVKSKKLKVKGGG